MAGPVPGPVGAAAGRPAHRGGAGKTRTKEHQMTSNTLQPPHPGQPALSRWQGRRAHGGPLRHRHRRPVVGDSPIPARLARWHRRGRRRPPPRAVSSACTLLCQRIGSTGRVEACEPPRRLLLTTARPTSPSEGQGVRRDESHRGHADRRRRPDHPGHRGTGHAPGPARRLRRRIPDPRRRSRRPPRRA